MLHDFIIHCGNIDLGKGIIVVVGKFTAVIDCGGGYGVIEIILEA